MTKVYAGTSGYSYKEWKGSFYPEKLKNDQMLASYAERLPAVEINSTFYRLPKSSVLRSWSEQVPDDFRFVLKASRRITHIKRLKDAHDETEYLLRTAGTLGDKLGAILYQLPGNLRKDLERLADFLDQLPAGTRSVFEFRSKTWEDDETRDCLRRYNAAWCVADEDGDEPAPVTATADFGYLRLRREAYDDQQLRHWVEAIGSSSWTAAYVFFKHEEAGAGPAAAQRFLAAARSG